MHAFMAVVNPDKITRVEDVQKKLATWEANIAKLKSRYGEDVSGKIKMAIFVGMLPKELQDLVLQNSAMTSDDIPYEKIRDQVLSIANQRIAMRHPYKDDPMDLGCWG